MRNDPFQAEVARIALGGGQALVAHGIVDRPTEDVDLFTDLDGGVLAAATVVRDALENAGFGVVAIPDVVDLANEFQDFDLGMTE